MIPLQRAARVHASQPCARAAVPCHVVLASLLYTCPSIFVCVARAPRQPLSRSRGLRRLVNDPADPELILASKRRRPAGLACRPAGDNEGGGPRVAAAVRRRPAGAGAGAGRGQRVRTRLRPPRLPHLHHLRLQSRRDERGAEVRAGGPGRHGRAAGGAHRRHQRLLPRRLAGGGLDVRPRGTPPRRRHLRGHVPRRVRRHRRRRRVRRAHGGPARRRRRVRVRPRRRARLHHRDRAGELAWVPLLHPRDRRQLGHPAQLHRRLRARRPPDDPQLAPHDRHRRSPAALPRGGGDARHAGDPALARPPRPPGRGPPRARAHRGGRRRRRPPPPGDRGLRPGRVQERRRLRRQVVVDGRVGRDPAPPDAGRPPRDARHRRAPGFPAGLRRGGAGAVRAAGVQPRRDHLGPRRAGRHSPPRRRQDGGHRGPALPRRPPRPPADAAHQRRRHGRVAPGAGPLVARAGGDGGGLVVGGGDVRRGGGCFHGGVLAGVRAGDMDVRVGDPAAAAARAGDGDRDGGEPGDERRRGDDVHLHVRGGRHGRELLHLRGALGGVLGVRVRVPAGDQGEEPRGDGGALRRRGQALATGGAVVTRTGRSRVSCCRGCKL